MRDGSWSIAEVARMSDVTSRTLRHYDAVGLLPPAWVAADGRRYYRRPELLRLQRILLLRELGMGLKPIAEALEREADPVTVLREHRDRLAGERDRLARLVRTVDATIESLEGGAEMTAEQMFDGFEHNPYEAEARERWGDEAVDASYERIRNLTPEQAELARTGFTAGPQWTGRAAGRGRAGDRPAGAGAGRAAPRGDQPVLDAVGRGVPEPRPDVPRGRAVPAAPSAARR